MDILNDYGREGWEIINIRDSTIEYVMTPGSYKVATIYFLKRQLDISG